MDSDDIEATSPDLPQLTDDLVIELTEAQRNAIDRLCRGRNVTDAAKAAGVNRRTVHRWLTADPGFRAAYNAWQADALELARARLLTLADDAIDAVARSIHKGNATTAMGVLKSLGALSKPKAGLTDPKALQRQAENTRRAAAARQFHDDDLALMGFINAPPDLD